MSEWSQLLLGAAETQSGVSVGAMIGARGCVTQIDAANNVYMISIAWQGLAPTVVPPVACGQGQYGTDDRLRRVITTLVRIGTLT